MKKYLMLLWAVVVLLCGCTNQGADASLPIETEPVQYYVPNSAVEQGTNGAIMQYSIPQSNYLWVKILGDRILLASEDDTAWLRLINPDDGILEAGVKLPKGSLKSCQLLSEGVVYYAAEENSAIFLDLSLQQIRNVALPVESTDPLFSPDGKEVFYCRGNEIRAYNFETKLTRLVKSQSVASQTLTDIIFDGQILVCKTQDAFKNVTVQYISAQNGQTLTTYSNILSLSYYKDAYFLQRLDGVVLQNIVGIKDGHAAEFDCENASVFSALELGGVVEYHGTAAATVQLNYCDIDSGKITSRIEYPGFSMPDTILADAKNKCIWLLTFAESSSVPHLLRWDITKSPFDDESIYVNTLYTAQSPDEKALKQLNDRVDAMNSKYGVKIRIWEDAVSVPAGHKLEVEYQPEVIEGILDQLESVLKEFPKRFVYKSISSRVRICIVRSVDGAMQGNQYWSGKYAFITLTPDTDIRSDFLDSFGVVVDSHVLGNSPIYDYWNDLNPENFVYGGAIDESLATGENRAFASVDSMISGTNDRSRIFWEAMQPDNADMFASEIMQNKLTMVCKGIRDAWNLEKSTEAYPWEQYLLQPILHKKK